MSTNRSELTDAALELVRATGRRPVAVTIVALVALVFGVLLTVRGVSTLLDAEGDKDELFSGAVALFFAAVALLSAVGSFLVKRWAWVLFMSWAVWGLTINLLRVFFFDDPQYLLLGFATLAVFVLTPLDVQVAFRVRNPPNVRLDAPGRNPLDRV